MQKLEYNFLKVKKKKCPKHLKHEVQFLSYRAHIPLSMV